MALPTLLTPGVVVAGTALYLLGRKLKKKGSRKGRKASRRTKRSSRTRRPRVCRTTKGKFKRCR